MAGKQKKVPVMLKVLKAESAVLDSIIVRQGAIRDTVVAKDWVSLEDSMLKMDRLSSRFMELEEQRMNLERDTVLNMRGESYDDTDDAEDIEPIALPLTLTFEERASLYGDKKVSAMLTKVRTKLARSKIENNALNAYVSAANGFLKGVFDKIIPQKRNNVYNRYGKMSKPAMQSLVIDRVF